MVDCIDDVDDGVAVIVVFRPDRPNAALAPEVPELEHGRGKSYLPGWVKTEPEMMTICERIASGRGGGVAYCSGPPSGRFCLVASLACHYIWS